MASRRRQSQQTPQNRRSVLGFGSATSKLRSATGQQVKQRLNYSSSKPMGGNISGSSKRWSSQGSHQQFKDSRPLNNRGYQKQMIEEILEFLNATGYPHPVSVKILLAPTTKEFLRVFEHLYSLLDSDFKIEKKFEEEIPRIFKSLCYPYPLSKSAMFAIGSLHTWPALLGALHWLVGNIKIVTDIDIDTLLFPINSVDDESLQKKMFLDYDHAVYKMYMEGEDSFTDQNEYMENALLKQAGCSEEDQSLKMDEIAALEEECQILESEPDILEDALQEKTSLEENIAVSERCLKENDEKERYLHEQKRLIIEELLEAGVSVNQLGDPSRQEELKRKSADVRQQLDLFNAEKERLDSLSHQRELKYSQIYDKVSVIIQQHNNIAESLSRLPHIKQYLRGRSIIMKYDHNMKDIEQVNEMKDNLKALLVELSNSLREDKLKMEANAFTEKERLDKLEELEREKKDELIRLRKQLELIEKEFLNEEENEEGSYEAQKVKLVEQRELLDDQHNKLSTDFENAMKSVEIDLEKFEKDKEEYNREQDDYIDFLEKYDDKLMDYKKHADGCLEKMKADIRRELKAIEDEANNLPDID